MSQTIEGSKNVGDAPSDMLTRMILLALVT